MGYLHSFLDLFEERFIFQAFRVRHFGARRTRIGGCAPASVARVSPVARWKRDDGHPGLGSFTGLFRFTVLRPACPVDNCAAILQKMTWYLALSDAAWFTCCATADQENRPSGAGRPPGCSFSSRRPVRYDNFNEERRKPAAELPHGAGTTRCLSLPPDPRISIPDAIRDPAKPVKPTPPVAPLSWRGLAVASPAPGAATAKESGWKEVPPVWRRQRAAARRRGTGRQP